MKIILESYEINPSTMALLSGKHCDYSTIVMEKNQILYICQTPTEIVKAACLEGGASYDGRRKSVTHRTGSKQKVPIPINPRAGIYAFPTQSPKSFECSWIFYHHVKTFKGFITPNEKTIQSTITFKNGHELTVNESPYILEKQMQRTAMCILCFSK